jgi:hypothetical protein
MWPTRRIGGRPSVLVKTALINVRVIVICHTLYRVLFFCCCMLRLSRSSIPSVNPPYLNVHWLMLLRAAVRRGDAVKPWINCGLGLVSSGNKQFDDIIGEQASFTMLACVRHWFTGGGYALGTVTLIAADRHSNFAESLCSYALAEGLSAGHDCLCLFPQREFVQQTLSKLPFNLTYSGEHPEANGPSGNDPDSTNKTPGSFKSSTSCVRYCCSYDLSRR